MINGKKSRKSRKILEKFRWMRTHRNLKQIINKIPEPVSGNQNKTKSINNRMGKAESAGVWVGNIYFLKQILHEKESKLKNTKRVAF